MLDVETRREQPTSPEEVQAVVAEAAAAGRRLEIVGGGTKRGVGRIEGAELTLSLAKLDAVLDYAPEELVLTAQPGVRIADLERLVAGQGQMLAFEPPRSLRQADRSRSSAAGPSAASARWPARRPC